MEVIVGISNRHIHLTEEDYKILFGEEKMNEYKKINQPGQYASDKFVTIKNEDKSIDKVRVLGPFREYTQVEISKSDARYLKINPPVRESGNIKESSPITLVGPNGILNLNEGCIIADRHIHILPEQVKQYGLTGLEKVSVLFPGIRGGILNNVYIRESEQSYFELHIDTDDANSHLIENGDIGIILK